MTESHDAATLRALRDIDQDLAGLFAWGRRLCNESDTPGLAYLLAHIGRELTLCLIRELETPAGAHMDALESDEPLRQVFAGRIGEALDIAACDARVTELAARLELIASERFEAPLEERQTGEKFRYRIGNALGLSPNHEVVRRWSKVHRRFVAAAHARVPGPKVAPLRPAFAQLAELIYGRVAGYFETQQEIDGLARAPDPSSVPMEQLQSVLLRPVQRRRFFSRIDRVEWLAPLAKGGYFRHPPNRETSPDGSWRAQAWPEGEYLLRMAEAEPKRVAQLLNEVPDANENPIVWRSIAKAVTALPPAEGAMLAPKLARAMRLPYARLLSHSVVETATALAKRKQREAFVLVDALLWISDLPLLPERGPNDSTEAYVEELRKQRRQRSWTDACLLGRIEGYDLEQLTQHAFPVLREMDARRLIEVLSERLDRAMKHAVLTSHRYAAAIEETEKGMPEELADEILDLGDIEEGASRYWLRGLIKGDQNDSVRALLVREVYKTAQQMAAGGTATSTVIGKLLERGNEVYRRIAYAIMADAKELDANLGARLDAFVASKEAVDPPFGAVETAALLRAHFADATPEAQQAFVAMLEAGPSDQWRRARLRWFHDRIPDALVSMVKRLGVDAVKPDRRQQSLDETGSWSSGAHSVVHKSPMSAEDLAALGPEALARYLVTWRPMKKQEDPFEGPSVEGLASAVTTLMSDEPNRLGALLPALGSVRVPLPFLTAMAWGLRSGVQQKKAVDGTALAQFMRHLWTEAEQSEGRTAAWAGDAVCELAREYAQQGKLNARTRQNLWRALEAFVRSELAWRDDPAESLPATYAQTTSASRSRLSARVVEAIVALAWGEFLVKHARAKWPPPARTTAGDRASALFDEILEKSGPSAFAAHGVLGMHMNQLMWMAHEWTVARLPRLLDGGSEDPATRPAWASMLESEDIRPEVFPLLKPWYVRHAARLPADGSAMLQDSEWALAKELALHVIWAAVYGLCSPSDEDGLVNNAFARLPVAAKGHAYWSVWRAFTDAKRATPRYARNVITFWESRVEALEKMPPTGARDDEVEALLRLLATPHLRMLEVIRLGQRTSALIGRQQRINDLAWERLAKLATRDAGGTFVIVERMIDAVLRSDSPYLSFDDAAPVLRAVFRKGGEIKEQALALVNRIGEAGMTEFGELWEEARREDAD